MHYDRDEIAAYTDASLHILGSEAQGQADSIKNEFLNMVVGLPPWLQTLFIELDGANVATDLDTIVKLRKKISGTEERASGFFKPGDMTDEFNAAGFAGQFRSPAIWAPEPGEPTALPAACHEIAHRIDLLAGLSHRTGKRTANRLYLSDQSLNWNLAVLEEVQRKIDDPDRKVNLEKEKADFYVGYENIAQHVIAYKDLDQWPREAMAEMTTHYALSYALLEGNDQEVDGLLTRHYPILWPSYKKDMLPALQDAARELWRVKLEEIEDHVDYQRASQTGDFDEDKAHRLARLESAAGRIKPLLRDVETFVKADVWLFRQRQIVLNKYGTIDVATAKGRGIAVAAREGRDAVIKRAEDMRQEANLVYEFSIQQKNLAQLLEPDVSIADILKRFDTLKIEGGLENVRRFMQAQPTTRQVEEFRNLYWQECLAREDIAGGFAPKFPEFEKIVTGKIQELLAAGGPEKLEESTAALRLKVELINDYIDFKKRQSHYSWQHSPQELEEFDRLLLHHGEDGVRALMKEEAGRISPKESPASLAFIFMNPDIEAADSSHAIKPGAIPASRDFSWES
jgi:hypothetical protein